MHRWPSTILRIDLLPWSGARARRGRPGDSAPHMPRHSKTVSCVSARPPCSGARKLYSKRPTGGLHAQTVLSNRHFQPFWASSATFE
jgi:hypothetical protein